VRHWPRSSADAARWAPAWLVGAAYGLGAEWVASGWDRPRDWIPDLITGWSLLAGGLLALARRPSRVSGTLLALTGAAWFVPNFADAGLASVDWIAAHSLYLHRGPLIALVLTYPGLRMRDRSQLAALLAGLALGVTPSVWTSQLRTLIVVGALLAVSVIRCIRADDRTRGLRLASVEITSLVIIGLATIATVRLATPSDAAVVATLRGYEALLGVVALAAVAGLIRAPWNPRGLTDSVIELGEARSSALRNELARALGDPSLQVGYWSASAAQFMDVNGQPVLLPAVGSARAFTVVGEPAIAVLVHDPVFRADQQLLDAVTAAARLASRHTALRREVHGHVLEVAASRRRVVAAADEERRRLELRLRDGAQRRLDGLSALLRRVDSAAAGGLTRHRIGRALDQVERVQDELGRLARGIHPRELEERGFESALRSVAAASATPVELSISAVEIEPEVAACAYFVCAEALANIAKHARASRVRIEVRTDAEAITVVIDDDGVGGADPANGTGLRGLADRIDTLGGELSVESPAGGGTHLTAILRTPGQPTLRR